MRIRGAVGLGVLGALAACGGSGIIEPTTALGREAVYFDNLLGSACTPSGERCVFLGAFALPPAFGAAASSITVDTGTGPLDWHGFVYDVVDSAAKGSISETFALMAFSDTTVIDGIVIGNGGASYLTDSTNLEREAYLTLNENVAGAQGSCARPPTLRHTMVPKLGGGTTCTIETFAVSVQAGFSPSGTAVTLAPQSVNGIRIVRLGPGP